MTERHFYERGYYMKTKRFLCLLLVLLLCLALLPTAAFAADIQAGTNLTAGSNLTGTQVYFGSFGGNAIKWYVVAMDSGTATLWTTTSMEDKPYDTSHQGGTHQNWSGSDICTWLNSTFKNNAFSVGEQAAMAVQYGTANELYSWGTIDSRQTIVLPSVNEIGNYTTTGTWNIDQTTRTFSETWWLRSPGETLDRAAFVFNNGNVFVSGHLVYDYRAIRPAFKLNLSSVIFTSAASGASGKSSATVGGGLVGASAPTGAVKFTMQDTNQALSVNATTAQSTQSGSTLTFSYANATAGSNQFVSCVLADGSGDVKYYGKLANSSSAVSGSLSIPLSGVANGTYTLKIFSEQANGHNYTDFCSAPVTMAVTVSGGTGTVSSFGGTVLSNNADLLSVMGQPVTATGTGTSASPKTAAINVATTKTSITFADITAAGASMHTYSNSGFSANEDAAINLSMGANHVYVKVTAEDGTTLYYDVTVNRAVVISGLPATYAMYEGGRVTWEPQPDGGTWDWDHSMFSATFNSPATFTALKAGTSTITYTVSGVSQSVTVTIHEAVLPKTGQSFTWAWALGALAVLCCGAAAFSFGRKRQRAR